MVTSAVSVISRMLTFRRPTRLFMFPFYVCVCTVVSPVKAGVSPATVQIQSSHGTTGTLVLAFDTQTHIPPRPRPPATPQACAASLSFHGRRTG